MGVVAALLGQAIGEPAAEDEPDRRDGERDAGRARCPAFAGAQPNWRSKKLGAQTAMPKESADLIPTAATIGR